MYLELRNDTHTQAEQVGLSQVKLRTATEGINEADRRSDKLLFLQTD